MKKKIYKVGLVGAGHIANTFHMPAWERNKKSKIVSNCATNKKNFKKISQKYKIKSTFINYKKMLNKENLDLINICTPPHRHYKDIILACKFNKHILVEKPFVLRFSEAKKIANLLKNKTVVFAFSALAIQNSANCFFYFFFWKFIEYNNPIQF